MATATVVWQDPLPPVLPPPEIKKVLLELSPEEALTLRRLVGRTGSLIYNQQRDQATDSTDPWPPFSESAPHINAIYHALARHFRPGPEPRPRGSASALAEADLVVAGGVVVKDRYGLFRKHA